MKIVEVSHLDHALTLAHVEWILARFASKDGFFIETVELPADLPALPCGLHGPLMGDAPVPEAEASYATRGNRPGASRMCARSARETRLLSVIAGSYGEDHCVLFTAFGGPFAPREPFDPGLSTETDRAASAAFWAEHALSADPAELLTAAPRVRCECGDGSCMLCDDNGMRPVDEAWF